MTKNLPSILVQFALFLGVAMLMTCTEPSSVECPSGRVCPVGTVCAAAQDVCIANGCGDNVLDTGETCDDGNVRDGDGCSADCESDETCGNGTTDTAADEVCDDGNTVDGDDCSADCKSSEVCGNGIVDTSVDEVCDDGNNDSGDDCRADCLSDETCGNGELDSAVGEACDDGNTQDGDACSSDCTASAGCGNGFVDEGEICDDHNQVDDDGCSANCLSDETCGNGTIDFAAGEVCDDTNTDSGDGCRSDCHSDETCGNDELDSDPGVTPDPEQCDDGLLVDGDGCSHLCQLEVCGNGVLDDERGESCDDGNTSDGPCVDDPTNPSCLEVCPVGNECDPGFFCSDITNVCDGLDSCSHDCQSGNDCGNGVRDATEECDDGNLDFEDDCIVGESGTIRCALARCGDGYADFQPANVEDCDGDGDGDPGQTADCDIDCTDAECGDGVVNVLHSEAGVFEQCDTEGQSAFCNDNCTITRCGDGIPNTDAGEECDTAGNSATCNADCTLGSPGGPICGDGNLNPAHDPDGVGGISGEQCDDGGTASFDGCSATCEIEPFTLTIGKVGTAGGTVTSNVGAISCGAACSETYITGQSVILTAAPNPLAAFTGWTGTGVTCPGTGTCTVSMTASKNVVAVFDINRLTVTKAGTGGGDVVSDVGGINCGPGPCSAEYNSGQAVLLTPTADPNSDFGGWSNGCTGATCNPTMTGARTATATFNPKTRTLSTTIVGNGTVTSVPAGVNCTTGTCNNSFANGTTVTLFAAPATGFAFTNWSGTAGCTGTGTCQVTMSATTGTVIATFTDNVDPTVSITTPTPPAFTTSAAALTTLAGTATDNVAVTSVTWVNAANAGTGTATFTAPNWSVPTIALVAGQNVITVTSHDAAGRTASAVITVTRDNTSPTVVISTPSSSGTFTTASTTVALTGIVSDNVAVSSVSWVNSAGGSGTASGTIAWSVASVALSAGLNTITVTATDTAGNTGNAVIAITRDNTNPVVTITAPTSNPNLTTNLASIALGGTASDGVGVASVAWVNSAGGSGAATGTTVWSVPTVALTAGTNTITVTVTDTAGNIGTDQLVVIRDNTAPAVAITAPTTLVTNAATLTTLAGTVSDANGVASVTWSNAANAASGAATVTSGWSVASIALVAGSNVITVTATDNAGNTATAQITMVRDNTNPVVAITTPATSTVVTASATLATLAGTANDANGITSVAWTCPTCTPTSGTASFTAPNWSQSSITLAAGNNVITVTATDAATNTGTAQVTVIRDNTNPTATIVTPAVNPFVTTSATLTTLAGTAADANGITSVTWACPTCTPTSGVASGTTNWSVASITLAAGNNVITVTATDAAANTGTAQITVTRDNTAPAVSIENPTNSPTLTTTAATLSGATALGGTASDNTALASVTWVNGANSTSGAATVTLGWTVSSIALVAGANVITVTATDTAGNTSTDVLTVTRDNAAPTVTITGPSGTSPFVTTAGSVTVDGTAADNIGVTQVTWTCATCTPTGATATGTTSWTTGSVVLSAGNNTITVTATDAAGNSSNDVIVVNRDNTLPVVTITAPASTPTFATNGTTTALGGTATDNLAVASVTWVNAANGTSGAAPVVAGAWSVASVSLVIGDNPIFVTVTDTAGNTSFDAITVTRNDVSDPTADIVNPSSSGTFLTSAATIGLDGTATDNVAVISVTWTCPTCAPTSGTASFTAPNWSIASVGLAAGANVITVTAHDGAARTGTDAITVTRDSTNPTVTITGPSSGTTFATTASTLSGANALGGTASDNVAVTSVTWACPTCTPTSGTATGTATWSVTSIGLAAGDNVVTVTSHDGAGNTGTDAITVTRDNTNPTVTIVNPADGTVTNVGILHIDGLASDNKGVTSVTWVNSLGGNGVATGTTVWSFENLPLVEGDNVITVTSHDAAGNTSTDVVTVTYDATAPVLVIAHPTDPADVGAAATVDLDGTASDAVGIDTVTWENVTTSDIGTATGTDTWTITGVPLMDGDNMIIVTATDDAGNSTSTLVTVTTNI